MPRLQVYLLVGAVIFKSLWLIPALSDRNRPLAPTLDAREYETLARNLLNVGKFSLEPTAPYHPDALRTPLYPLFIAVIYFFLGHNPLIVAIVQVLISMIPLLLIWRLDFLDSETKRWTGILYVFNVNIAFYAVQLLSEILFMVLLISGLTLVYFFKGETRASHFMAGGLFLGLATLTRPIVVFLPVIIAAFLLVSLRTNRLVMRLILFLFVYSAVVSTWCIRNLLVFDRFFLSSAFTYNLASFDAPLVMAIEEKIDVNEATERFWSAFDSEAAAVKPASKNDTMALQTRLAVDYLRRHPFSYLKVRSIGVISILLTPLPLREALTFATGKSPEELNLTKRAAQNAMRLLSGGRLYEAARVLYKERIGKMPTSGLVVFALGVCYHTLLLFGVACFLIRRRRGRPGNDFLVLLIITVIYLLVIPGSLGYSRFRVPIEPVLVLLAGVGLARNQGEP